MGEKTISSASDLGKAGQMHENCFRNEHSLTLCNKIHNTKKWHKDLNKRNDPVKNI